MYLKKCPLPLDKANTAILTIFYRSLLDAKKVYQYDEQRFMIEMSKQVSKLARDFGMITGLANLDTPPLTEEELEQFMEWYQYQSPVFQDKLESESMAPELKEIMGKLYNNTLVFTTYKRVHTEFIKELEAEYEANTAETKPKLGFWQKLVRLVIKDS